MNEPDSPRQGEDLPDEPRDLERADGAQDQEDEEITEAQIVVPAEQFGRIVQELEILEHSGPLPPPQELAEYDNVLPGLAERIVALTEKEQEHRQQLERDAMRTGRQLASRSQLIAAGIAVLVISVGTAIILSGHSVAGIVALLTPLLPILVAFLGSQRRRRRDTENGEASED